MLLLLLGIAKRFMSIKTGTRVELHVKHEMTSGDYENLIQVMEHYFGDLIIMYR
jgi:hypothetical protein